MSLDSFQQKINYKFKNLDFLKIALTHSSYMNESKNHSICNERQEFLGDAVLQIIVSDYIFNHLDVPEGELTKIRASLVCENALFSFSKKIDLGDELFLGHGEECNGGRTRASLNADAFEALIAGIYLDGGIEEAKKFVLPFIKDLAKNATGNDLHDYKTQLQEIIQQNPEEKLTYVLTNESGPDHKKMFTVEVRLNSNVIGKGTANSKKNAEQLAAKEALKLMGKGEKN